MKISLLIIRKNRAFANWCELMSLKVQNYPPEDFEVICVDDSTTDETPIVFDSFKDDMNIQFYRFTGWEDISENDRKAHQYVGPQGKLSTALHLNYALSKATGKYIVVEWGEMIHLGESLFDIQNAIESYNNPATVYIPPLHSIDEESLRTHDWRKHPEALWSRPDIWREIVCPCDMETLQDHQGALAVAMRREQLERLGGFNESPLEGYDCGWDLDDEDLVRRLLRSDANVVVGNKYNMAMIDHGSDASVTHATNAADYRGKMRNRIRKDGGYWGNQSKYPYYRPGTEKTPLIAQDTGEWENYCLKVLTLEDVLAS
jgi:hypothetical protein